MGRTKKIVEIESEDREEYQDLQMYVGKFRVRFEQSLPFDKNEKPENLEFMYIPCKYGADIYRYNKNKLNVYFPSKQWGRKVQEQLPKIFTEFLCGSKELILQFDEKYIDEVAKIVEPMIKGKNIQPGKKHAYKSPDQVKKGTADQYNFSKKKIKN